MYGIRPWEVGKLRWTDVRHLLRELGYVRYLRDEAHLLYHFGKFSDEDAQKLLSKKEGGGKSEMRGRAYQEYIRRYQLEDTEDEGGPESVPDLPLSATACEGLLRFIEQKHIPTAAYNFQLIEIIESVKFKAKGWKREQRQLERFKSGSPPARKGARGRE